MQSYDKIVLYKAKYTTLFCAEKHGGAGIIENRLKDYHHDRGKTQTELSKLVRVRRETIYNLENGKYSPSLSLAWKVAEVFDVSIEDGQSFN